MKINPIIHLNGTGEKTLKEDYLVASRKLEEFIKEWQNITFHSRDYYPLGPEAFSEAVKERKEMNKNIQSIENYLERILIHLHDSIK